MTDSTVCESEGESRGRGRLRVVCGLIQCIENQRLAE